MLARPILSFPCDPMSFVVVVVTKCKNTSLKTVTYRSISHCVWLNFWAHDADKPTLFPAYSGKGCWSFIYLFYLVIIHFIMHVCICSYCQYLLVIGIELNFKLNKLMVSNMYYTKALWHPPKIACTTYRRKERHNNRIIKCLNQHFTVASPLSVRRNWNGLRSGFKIRTYGSTIINCNVLRKGGAGGYMVYI